MMSWVLLRKGLHQAVRCLAPEGRVSVITFHSLEDRICKQIFSSYPEAVALVRLTFRSAYAVPKVL